MTHQAAASSSEERLKQLMQTLDAFCDDSSGQELRTLANEAKTIVVKMQNVLERSLVEHLAKLVRAKQWDKATAMLSHHFTLDQYVGRVEEVLVLVGVDVDSMACAINWVDKLDVQLKLRAYEALYEQLKFKKFNNEPQVLLLWVKVGNLPGGVLDSVRDELDKDFQQIAETIVAGVKKSDYSLSQKIDSMTKSSGYRQIMNELIVAVVQKYGTFGVENTMRLVQYSLAMTKVGYCCVFIDALFKALASRKLLKSEQALHLFAHAKYTKEHQQNWKNASPMIQKLCTDVLDKLTKEKPRFFQIYQKFVEDKDEKKIQQLHTKNWQMSSILAEFVDWYYTNKEDLSRAQKLLSVVKAVGHVPVAQTMLTELHSQMSKFQQLNTFEAFCLFNELKLLTLVQNYKTLEPRCKEVLEQLKSKAPSCLQLLFWPRGEKLQVVNKFFDLPLSIDNDAVVCCESRSAEGSTSVDRDSAMTTFSFNNGAKCWKLDADALEDSATKQPWTGTQWKLKAVDDTHLKIFTNDGKFLTAEEPCRNDKNKRVVCLKRENSTGMQLWKIEPAKKMKMMKIEPVMQMKIECSWDSIED